LPSIASLGSKKDAMPVLSVISNTARLYGPIKLGWTAR